MYINIYLDSTAKVRNKDLMVIIQERVWQLNKARKGVGNSQNKESILVYFCSLGTGRCFFLQ